MNPEALEPGGAGNRREVQRGCKWRVERRVSEFGQLPRLLCESGQLRTGHFEEIFRMTNPGEWLITGKLGGWEESHTLCFKVDLKNSRMLVLSGPGTCLCSINIC